jgi:hypothetical protein
VSGKGLVRVRVKFAGARVALDGGVELLGIKGFEPGTKARQLARRELLNGFLDILGGSHGQNIAFALETEKERAGPLAGLNPDLSGDAEGAGPALGSADRIEVAHRPVLRRMAGDIATRDIRHWQR